MVIAFLQPNLKMVKANLSINSDWIIELENDINELTTITNKIKSPIVAAQFLSYKQ